jgi:hypothetical protein
MCKLPGECGLPADCDFEDGSDNGKFGKVLENKGLRDGTQAHMIAMLHSRPDHIAMSTPLALRMLAWITRESRKTDLAAEI